VPRLVASLGPTIHDRLEYAEALRLSTLVAPRIRETFELSIDGDKVDPMDMLKRDGYDTEYFEFLGPAIDGIITGQFKLITLDSGDIRECERLVKDLGYRLAEGQWREPFLHKFPRNNEYEYGEINFAGSRWLQARDWLIGVRHYPAGKIFWPVLYNVTAGWQIGFHWNSGSYSSPENLRVATRWLVKVE